MRKITIRNIHKEDITKIIALQRWPSAFLENHRTPAEGQLCVELERGKIIASASGLIISLKPPYRDHTWHEITGNGMFDNHDPNGDTLYGADISTHPKFQGQGIGTMLYMTRKKLVIKLNLKRMVVGGRLYNYCKQADKIDLLRN
jgi:GNAT superfamily N-acetyltransferase